MSAIPVLLLPNTPAHARLANAIANWCDGEFRQNSPDGQITVTGERSIVIERARLVVVDGFLPTDEEWTTLASCIRRGCVVEHTPERLVFADKSDGPD